MERSALIALLVLTGCGAPAAPVAVPVAEVEAPEELVWIQTPMLFQRVNSSPGGELYLEQPLLELVVQRYRQVGARRVRVLSTLMPMTPCPVGIPEEQIDEAARIADGTEPILSSAEGLRRWHEYTDALVRGLVQEGIEREQIEVVLDPRVQGGAPEAPYLHARIVVDLLVPPRPSLAGSDVSAP